MNPKIQFLGIGVQKSGTTWIHRILQEHPELCLSNGKDKDTKFFGAYYDRGYEWYESQFQECSSSTTTIGEVSTSYFYNSDAPERIYNYNKDMRLFVCLRNPVDRIISNHKHEVRAGHVSGENMKLEMALENNPAYIMQSCYARHLKNWYKYYSKQQIHIIIFDEVISNPAGLVKDLYKYLGVVSDFKPDMSVKNNVSRIPKSRFIERSIKVVGQAVRGVGLGKVVDVGRQSGINDWLRAKNTSCEQNDVIIMPETIDRIKFSMRDEVQELSNITGIDLTAWL